MDCFTVSWCWIRPKMILNWRKNYFFFLSHLPSFQKSSLTMTAINSNLFPLKFMLKERQKSILEPEYLKEKWKVEYFREKSIIRAILETFPRKVSLWIRLRVRIITSGTLAILVSFFADVAQLHFLISFYHKQVLLKNCCKWKKWNQKKERKK